MSHSDCRLHILVGLFADMKRHVVNDENESFDTSFRYIPLDVFKMVYEITAVSGLSCHIEFKFCLADKAAL